MILVIQVLLDSRHGLGLSRRLLLKIDDQHLDPGALKKHHVLQVVFVAFGKEPCGLKIPADLLQVLLVLGGGILLGRLRRDALDDAIQHLSRTRQLKDARGFDAKSPALFLLQTTYALRPPPPAHHHSPPPTQTTPYPP